VGPVVRGFTPPMADVTHAKTLLHGCLSRFCTKNPDCEQGVLDRLGLFVDSFLTEFLRPLPLDIDSSFKTWIESTTYSLERKEELQTCHEELKTARPRRLYECKSHGKRETYLKYKPARGINSRSDHFKVLTGPWFKLIESEVYKLPAFIKHVPVCRRAQYMVDMFQCTTGNFKQTDYSHFESHFVPAVMAALELRLYKYMLLNYPEVYEEIHHIASRNKCHFKDFSISILGVRMSGDVHFIG